MLLRSDADCGIHHAGAAVAELTARGNAVDAALSAASSAQLGIQDLLQSSTVAHEALLHSFFVLNCQMGRGRTTTGMVIATLWCIHRLGIKVDFDELRAAHRQRTKGVTSSGHVPNAKKTVASLVPPAVAALGHLTSKTKDADALIGDSDNEDADTGPHEFRLPTLDLNNPTSMVEPLLQQQRSISPSLTINTAAAPTPVKPVAPSSPVASMQAPNSPVPMTALPVPTSRQEKAAYKQALMRGEYRMVQSLVRVLPDGVQIKQEVDCVIDHADHMQNLRLAIYDLKERARASLPSRRAVSERRCVNYLVRYFFLIVFDAYLRDEASKGFATSFADWYKEHPAIQNIINQYSEEADAAS